MDDQIIIPLTLQIWVRMNKYHRALILYQALFWKLRRNPQERHKKYIKGWKRREKGRERGRKTILLSWRNKKLCT